MIVTTGARPAFSPPDPSANNSSSSALSLTSSNLWPISSTTSTAVSWSRTWLIVAISPIFIMVLITSLDLIANLLASSPTVMVSPNLTTRSTGCAGLLKPCLRCSPACFLDLRRRREERSTCMSCSSSASCA